MIHVISFLFCKLQTTSRLRDLKIKKKCRKLYVWYKKNYFDIKKIILSYPLQWFAYNNIATSLVFKLFWFRLKISQLRLLSMNFECIQYVCVCLFSEKCTKHRNCINNRCDGKSRRAKISNKPWSDEFQDTFRKPWDKGTSRPQRLLKNSAREIHHRLHLWNYYLLIQTRELSRRHHLWKYLHAIWVQEHSHELSVQ